MGMSGAFRRLQTGYVRSYALSVLLGAVIVLARPAGGEPRMTRQSAIHGAHFSFAHDLAGDPMTFPWLTSALVLPLVGALVVMFLPRRSAAEVLERGSDDTPKKVALGFSLATLVLVGAIAWKYDTSASGFQMAEEHTWIEAFGAHYALGVDGVGLTLLLLTAILTPVVIAASWNDGDRGRWSVNSFFAWMLALEGLAIGVFAATDVFLFYVLFEATLIPIYFLIGGFGGARRSYAAIKFLIFSLLGGLVMLASVIGLYVESAKSEGGATYLLSELAPIMAEADTGFARWLFVGFFIAFAAKAPMVPVHTWLPDAADEATPGTSVLLVSILDKIGTFGMLRFALGLFPEASTWATPVVLVLAVISILYGAIVAIGQRSIPRLIAYTSVSHFGFIVLGIFVMNSQGLTGSTLYMFNHGLSTGVLFLVTGFLIARRGSRQIADFGGVQKVAPVLAGIFLVGGLSSLVAAGPVAVRLGVPGVRRGLRAQLVVRRVRRPGHRAGRALHPADVPADHDRTGPARGRRHA